MKTCIGRYFEHVFCSLLMLTRNASKATQVIGGSRTVTQGKNVDLFCHLIDTDEELTQITWQKKTREKPENHNFFVIEPTGKTQHVDGLGDRVRFIGSTKENVGSISLSGVRLLDEGTYTCIFTVFPSGPYKTEIPLNVLVPPVMSPVSVDFPPVIGEREVVLATCTAAGAKPPAEVRWHTGALDASVRTVTNSTQHANGTTTVHSYLLGVPSRAANHQEVQCVVNQSALATETTLPYTIDIHYQPVSVNITVSDDTSQALVFQCVALANPGANYTFSRVNPPWPAVRVEGDTLHLSLSSELDGLYVCEASNPYGRATGSLYVHHQASGPCTACGVLLGLILFLIAAAAVFVGYRYKFRTLPRLDITPLQACVRKEDSAAEDASTALPTRRTEESPQVGPVELE